MKLDLQKLPTALPLKALLSRRVGQGRRHPSGSPWPQTPISVPLGTAPRRAVPFSPIEHVVFADLLDLAARAARCSARWHGSARKRRRGSLLERRPALATPIRWWTRTSWSKPQQQDTAVPVALQHAAADPALAHAGRTARPGLPGDRRVHPAVAGAAAQGGRRTRQGRRAWTQPRSG